jgi:hypothetical protein
MKKTALITLSCLSILSADDYNFTGFFIIPDWGGGYTTIYDGNWYNHLCWEGFSTPGAGDPVNLYTRSLGGIPNPAKFYRGSNGASVSCKSINFSQYYAALTDVYNDNGTYFYYAYVNLDPQSSTALAFHYNCAPYTPHNFVEGIDFEFHSSGDIVSDGNPFFLGVGLFGGGTSDLSFSGQGSIDMQPATKVNSNVPRKSALITDFNNLTFDQGTIFLRGTTGYEGRILDSSNVVFDGANIFIDDSFIADNGTVSFLSGSCTLTNTSITFDSALSNFDVSDFYVLGGTLFAESVDIQELTTADFSGGNGFFSESTFLGLGTLSFSGASIVIDSQSEIAGNNLVLVSDGTLVINQTQVYKDSSYPWSEQNFQVFNSGQLQFASGSIYDLDNLSFSSTGNSLTDSQVSGVNQMTLESGSLDLINSQISYSSSSYPSQGLQMDGGMLNVDSSSFKNLNNINFHGGNAQLNNRSSISGVGLISLDNTSIALSNSFISYSLSTNPLQILESSEAALDLDNSSINSLHILTMGTSSSFSLVNNSTLTLQNVLMIEDSFVTINDSYVNCLGTISFDEAIFNFSNSKFNTLNTSGSCGLFSFTNGTLQGSGFNLQKVESLIIGTSTVNLDGNSVIGTISEFQLLNSSLSATSNPSFNQINTFEIIGGSIFFESGSLNSINELSILQGTTFFLDTNFANIQKLIAQDSVITITGNSSLSSYDPSKVTFLRLPTSSGYINLLNTTYTLDDSSVSGYIALNATNSDLNIINNSSLATSSSIALRTSPLIVESSSLSTDKFIMLESTLTMTNHATVTAGSKMRFNQSEVSLDASTLKCSGSITGTLTPIVIENQSAILGSANIFLHRSPVEIISSEILGDSFHLNTESLTVTGDSQFVLKDYFSVKSARLTLEDSSITAKEQIAFYSSPATITNSLITESNFIKIENTSLYLYNSSITEFAYGLIQNQAPALAQVPIDMNLSAFDSSYLLSAAGSMTCTGPMKIMIDPTSYLGPCQFNMDNYEFIIINDGQFETGNLFSGKLKIGDHFYRAGSITGTGSMYILGTVHVGIPITQNQITVGYSNYVDDYFKGGLAVSDTVTLTGTLSLLGEKQAKLIGTGSILADVYSYKGFLSPAGRNLPKGMDITGNVTFDDKTTLYIEFDELGNDKLSIVDHDMSIQSGCILQARALSSFPQTLEYQIIEMIGSTPGLVTGNFDYVTKSHALIDFKVINKNNGIFLEATNKNFASFATTPNQLQVANALDALNNASIILPFMLGDDQQTVISNTCINEDIQTMQLMNEYDLSAVYQTMDVSQYKNQQIIFEEMTCTINDELNRHLYNPKDKDILSLNGGYQYINQNSYGQYTGISSKNPYVYISGIKNFSSLKAMLSLGGYQSYSTYKNFPSSTSANSAFISLGAAKIQKRWSVGVDGLYSSNFISSKRTVLTFNQSPKTNHRGYSAKANIDIRYRYNIRDLELLPYEDLSYVYTHENKFQEHSGSCLSFKVKSSNRQMIRNALGIQLSHNTDLLNQYIDLSYIFEHRFDGKSYRCDFIQTEGAPMTLQGLTPVQNFVKGVLGVKGYLKGWNVGMSVNGQYGNRYRQAGIQGSIDKKF